MTTYHPRVLFSGNPRLRTRLEQKTPIANHELTRRNLSCSENQLVSKLRQMILNIIKFILFQIISTKLESTFSNRFLLQSRIQTRHSRTLVTVSCGITFRGFTNWTSYRCLSTMLFDTASLTTESSADMQFPIIRLDYRRPSMPISVASASALDHHWSSRVYTSFLGNDQSANIPLEAHGITVVKCNEIHELVHRNTKAQEETTPVYQRKAAIVSGHSELQLKTKCPSKKIITHDHTQKSHCYNTRAWH